MRLVDNHHRTAQPQHVHQRRLRLAIRARQQIVQPVGRHVQQMFGKRSVLVIHLAPGRVRRAKRLYRRNNHHRLAFHRRTRQPQRFLDGHHLHRAARQLQRAAIRMARIAQRIGGLIQYGIARHQPQHHRTLGAHEIVDRQPRRVARQQRLAAAGRHTQAHIRHLTRQPRHVDRQIRHGRRRIAQLHCLVGALRLAVARALLEKITQRFEYPFLIILESNHGAIMSCWYR